MLTQKVHCSFPQIHHGAVLLLLLRIRKWASHHWLIYVSHLSGKFNWKGNIKAILRASPDQELPVKKLRKKVLFTDLTLPIFEFKVEYAYKNSLFLYSFRFWQHTTLSLEIPILKERRTYLHFSTRRSATIQNLVLRKNEFDFWNEYFFVVHQL